MKKIALSVLAASVFAFASPAMASTLDINLGATNVNQTQNGDVAQRAASAAAAIGSTGNNVDIASTAVDAVQIASVTETVTQGANGFVNGNGLATNVNQVVNGAVDQAGISLAGSGDLGANSAISSTMANLGQSATVDVKVHQ